MIFASRAHDSAIEEVMGSKSARAKWKLQRVNTGQSPATLSHDVSRLDFMLLVATKPLGWPYKLLEAIAILQRTIVETITCFQLRP